MGELMPEDPRPAPTRSTYLRVLWRRVVGILKGQVKLKPRFVLTTEQTSESLRALRVGVQFPNSI